MKHPRKRRPRRTYRWEGCVDEVDGQTFWARLIPTDHDGPELEAEFDCARLSDPRPGRLFNLYAHRRGKKTRIVMRDRLPPPWTAEGVARVAAKARLRAMVLADLVD